MTILLLFIALLLFFKIDAAIEDFAPESILDTLQEKVLAGLDTVIFDGEYIFEPYSGQPLTFDEIYKVIEISAIDQKIIINRNRKFHVIRVSEAEEQLFKSGFER